MIDWTKSRVLVTGGTGSFGNFIVRKLLQMGAKEVRILSRDEKKQFDMRVFYENRPDLTFVIGDIRDKASVNEAMRGIQIVFQAAALKQVPTCENFPMESINTNVLGVENIVQSALQHAVPKVVCISTDKAVKPVNVMGMTKALQERLMVRGNLSLVNKSTKFMCVRYGNVLRSRGSLIPLFRSFLKQGKKLTITDEKMTRFLLTLNDAIDLVIYAAEFGEGGEIFVRKAPSARVLDIARVLCEEVGVAFDYSVIGKYPGEKIHEILISEEELERCEDCDKYYKIFPWWSSEKPAVVKKEFSSSDHVIGLSAIEDLIKRADREFEAMEMPGGEYAKF